MYIDFLRRLHDVLEAPTYLEIGIRYGDSLALSHSRSVGIDPDFDLQTEIPAETALFRETSDEYFDRADPLEPLGRRPISFAFIDGMHLVEFALRDFINVERHAHWTGVVVFDDILPRDLDEAARNRRTRAWAGDVYKIDQILARHRPDLIRVRVGTSPTGLLLVLGLDPDSPVLEDRYDDIIRNAVVPDPQRVPPQVVERRGAIEPEAVLSASFWPVLRGLRDGDVPREQGLRRLRRAVRKDLGAPIMLRPLRRLMPARA